MMKTKISTSLLVVCLFVLSSCTFTTGEGPVLEKGFAKSTFQGVELDGSFNVNINQGAQQHVVVKGQENIISKLKMDVLDGILYLSLEPGNYLNYELDVELTMPSLESVALSGSGDIKLGTFVGLNDLAVSLDGSGDIDSDGVLEVNGNAIIDLEGSGDIDLNLKANNIEAELDGSGDIDLKGSATTASLSLDGSGDIKAFKLEALRAEIELEGSGSIKVYASKNLKAILEGSGDIRYKGEPAVEAKIDGSGSIEAD
ncbi:MAG: head GIN domain-containing protein [Flavobacteriales bacterium]